MFTRVPPATRVTQIVLDHFTDIDVLLAWDLLNRVRRPDWTVKLLGTSGQHVSVASLTIPMHGRIEESADADAVLIATGPETRALRLDRTYLGRLRLDPAGNGSVRCARVRRFLRLSASSMDNARRLIPSRGTCWLRRALRSWMSRSFARATSRTLLAAWRVSTSPPGSSNRCSVRQRAKRPLTRSCRSGTVVAGAVTG